MKQTSENIGTLEGRAAGTVPEAQVLMPVDLHAEGRKVWATFQEMAAGMAGITALRRSPDFAYLDGIEDGGNLYTYFPFLFLETFPALDKEVFGKLSLMSLLYVHHIIITDSLLDDEHNLPRESILVSNACSLRALEVLTGLFGRKPFPWREMTELHQQYSQATALEKERPGGEMLSYSFQDLMSRLSRKSAMAKLIPLALCSLSGRRSYLGPLNGSFDLYYLSEQLVDDFRDWKEDLAAGRYSYLLTSVLNKCGIRGKVEGLEPDGVAEVVGKHMYLSGVAEGYLAQAIDYCEQAKDRVRGLACPRWIRFLDTFQMGIHVAQSNIAKRSRQLLLQTDKYDYALVPEVPPVSSGAGPQTPHSVPHPVPSVSPTISHAGQRAAEFLRGRYKPGVGFADFMMAPELLPVWVSGYVGVALLEWLKCDAGARAGRRPLRQMLRRMADGLKKKQGGGGWAPSAVMPEDADTSAWVLSFLSGVGPGERATFREAVDALLEYRRADGSFGTYVPGALGPGADGYYDSHVEVTAVVVNVLVKAGLDPCDEIIRGALAYVRAMQEDDGLWQAYWWDGQMYATYHCLRALKAGHDSLEGPGRDRIIDTIRARQGADGSWGETTFGKNKAFETALALKSLMLLDPSLAAEETVRSGITWLLNYQAADGGFYSGPMLRLPAREEKEPWLRQEWTPDTAYGFGILGRDEKRFFTTATALSALCDFLALAGDQRTSVSLRHVRGQRVITGQNAAPRP